MFNPVSVSDFTGPRQTNISGMSKSMQEDRGVVLARLPPGRGRALSGFVGGIHTASGRRQ